MRLAALVSLAATAVVAHGRGAHAQTLDRTKPPQPAAPAPFVFPKAQTQRLPNGLRVVLIENHTLPLVAVRAVIGVDSLADPIGQEGLFALTTGTLREGTMSMTADQLASAFTAIGNVILPLRFTTITQNFDRSLALMADMLMHPSFPQAAIDRVRATLVANQQRLLQVPATIPNRIFLARLFGADHSIARTASGSEATMAQITREDLQRFHDVYFRPNMTTIVVVGDVREADVVAAVTKSFGAWKSAELPMIKERVIPPPRPTTIYLIDRPGAQQSYVFVGTLGPERTSPDYAALEVLAPILGASTGSRLAQNLRDRHSYMYSGTPAAVTWRRHSTPAVIGGSAAVAAAKTDSALIEWLGELRGAAQRPPSEQEMTLAHGALVGALPAQFETQDLVANRVMSMLQNDVPLDFYNSYGTRIGAVRPADVTSVAAKYLDLSRLVIVVAGDRKVVEPALRAANIAPIVNVDERGKP
jgi:predicted Zn-dependent peptidase